MTDKFQVDLKPISRPFFRTGRPENSTNLLFLQNSRGVPQNLFFVPISFREIPQEIYYQTEAFMI
jgi:hypothetical protein